jgi:hypothetical protein
MVVAAAVRDRSSWFAPGTTHTASITTLLRACLMRAAFPTLRLAG